MRARAHTLIWLSLSFTFSDSKRGHVSDQVANGTSVPWACRSLPRWIPTHAYSEQD